MGSWVKKVLITESICDSLHNWYKRVKEIYMHRIFDHGHIYYLHSFSALPVCGDQSLLHLVLHLVCEIVNISVLFFLIYVFYLLY
ncbi:hypothetical protein HanIR_Chr06g0261071 [Helianthus annuus]|nr:hypothetical protein HanIR_Chr06g0261071 [Helianthus annuus]